MRSSRNEHGRCCHVVRDDLLVIAGICARPRATESGSSRQVGPSGDGCGQSVAAGEDTHRLRISCFRKRNCVCQPERLDVDRRGRGRQSPRSNVIRHRGSVSQALGLCVRFLLRNGTTATATSGRSTSAAEHRYQASAIGACRGRSSSSHSAAGSPRSPCRRRRRRSLSCCRPPSPADRR